MWVRFASFHTIFTQYSCCFHVIFTQISPRFHPDFTQISPKFHPNFTQLSPEFHLNFTGCSPDSHVCYTRLVSPPSTNCAGDPLVWTWAFQPLDAGVQKLNFVDGTHRKPIFTIGTVVGLRRAGLNRDIVRGSVNVENKW